jgi:hypothetical protein
MKRERNEKIFRKLKRKKRQGSVRQKSRNPYLIKL